MGSTYSFTSELWEWDGKAAWHFFSLPEEVTDEIDERHSGDAAGFGSVKVEVTIGSTTWQTSIFPDTKRGTFILPVKKAVRTAEDLADGSPAELHLRVLI
ncbi:MAG TPA: DUF1905 domain-containing protein [Acidimicrobiales bacterium]|jgi:hypothetical protein|nr:DUF1905 domain-containing protein [Acidimicrobiales bacterium]